MRALLSRGFAAMILASWIASAFLGHLVWLHVETEHHGHHHAEEHGPVLLGLHASAHGAHEHRLSSARGPGLPSPRTSALTPHLAYISLSWLDPPTRSGHHPSPIPRPRGSPPRHTVLLI